MRIILPRVYFSATRLYKITRENVRRPRPTRALTHKGNTMGRRDFLKRSTVLAGGACLTEAAHVSASSLNQNFPVAIRVQADKARGELRPIWRFFGADEPNYAYMRDGAKLIGELGEMRPRG